jgi:aspartyl-tRNA(Asn)/glutamyl-tRNA(Gln) amidotransferase subunit B
LQKIGKKKLIKNNNKMTTQKFTSDIVIGLEIHIELNTDSKLFCPCPTKGSEEPNTRTCPVCLGHPGSKPVLNSKAVDYAIKLGLALNCEIDDKLIFSRKSYFYPDMAKNYQITQYERPLCRSGNVTLKNGKIIGITRIHIEEDPAALIHPGSMHESPYVLVDYNRSGNPLCEIVTEPDMTSPEEAREFMKKLITTLEYLDIFHPTEGIIKADANISIKESGYVRSEIKNITGFKEIERALFYEVERQKQAIQSGEKLVNDTRSWDSDKGLSRRLRTKETEADYGYIIDPDLIVTEITSNYVNKIKIDMPEMADAKMDKFMKEHNIAEDTAEVLSKDKELAHIYEEACKEVNSELAAKWTRRELARVLNYNKKKFSEVDMTTQHFIDLLVLIEKKKITEKVAQQILNELINEPFDVNQYVKDKGLEQLNDNSEIEKYCKDVISEQNDIVEQVKNGEEKAVNFLVGQVMRKCQGKANPQKVKEILIELIK